MQLGDVELNSGHLDAAIDEYHMAIDDGFRTFIPYGNIAAVYALQGKMEEAKPFLAEALRPRPASHRKMVHRSCAELSGSLFEGYRKAGVPEE